MVVEVTLGLVQENKASGRIFVLSDIDGTLVPHPFFSGLTNAERGRYVARMQALFEHRNFGVVTGRAEDSYERLQHDSGLASRRPVFLGLEFATHLLGRSERFYTAPAAASLARLMSDLAHTLGERLEFASDEDILTRMARGRMEGYVLEPKTLVAQVEWYFPQLALQEAFGHFLREWLNPRLLAAPDLAVQLFPSRIDVLARGFVPKSGFFERLPPGVFETLFKGYDTLVVLGDELYDSYMFQYVKTLQGGFHSANPAAPCDCKFDIFAGAHF